jgi:hypothetical protein
MDLNCSSIMCDLLLLGTMASPKAYTILMLLTHINVIDVARLRHAQKVLIPDLSDHRGCRLVSRPKVAIYSMPRPRQSRQ